MQSFLQIKIIVTLQLWRYSGLLRQAKVFYATCMQTCTYEVLVVSAEGVRACPPAARACAVVQTLEPAVEPLYGVTGAKQVSAV